MSVVIETTLGDFTVDLFTEDRPHTCTNFLKLCKSKYYNFCLFHSVQHNFIAQTGDPTGTGKNGESIFGKIYGEEKKFFEAELLPKIKHSRTGLLSMVNCGNNMLGSQFFLTLSNDLQSLDNEHCVFGEVTEGFDILLKLNEIICDTEHRPYQDIRITHTVILEDPFDDPPGLQVLSSPEPSKETLLNGRIAPDEELDEGKGLSAVELEEVVRKREAQAQATILEIVGDLPDADMAPPENVLFICKLNPVTSDDDLEIIFSRFGKVKSCEVIRDKNTGDSLQYAFVEFEEQKSCEDAFFKMDNVLIDDRRIHVDFSQSVSKMKWKGKGRGVEHFDEDNSITHNQRSNKNNNRNESSQPAESRSRHESSKGRGEPREQDSSSKRRHNSQSDSRERYSKTDSHKRSYPDNRRDKGRSNDKYSDNRFRNDRNYVDRRSDRQDRHQRDYVRDGRNGFREESNSRRHEPNIKYNDERNRHSLSRRDNSSRERKDNHAHTRRDQDNHNLSKDGAYKDSQKESKIRQNIEITEKKGSRKKRHSSSSGSLSGTDEEVASSKKKCIPQKIKFGENVGREQTAGKCHNKPVKANQTKKRDLKKKHDSSSSDSTTSSSSSSSDSTDEHTKKNTKKGKVVKKNSVKKKSTNSKVKVVQKKHKKWVPDSSTSDSSSSNSSSSSSSSSSDSSSSSEDNRKTKKQK